MSKRCIGYNDITKEYIYYDEEGNVINSQKELEKDAETGLHTINDIWWKITKDFRDKNDVKDKQIADLEAKLAESNEQLEMAWDDFHRMQNEKIKVQHQLAEQPKQIVDKIKDFVHNNYIYVEETDLRVIKYDLLYKFLDNLSKDIGNE